MVSGKKQPVILFDLDGTLIDSTEAILDSFRQSYDELGGIYPGAEAIRAMIGHPLSEMYRSFGVPSARVEEYVATYKRHYRQVHTLKTTLLPGAEEAISEAADFARLGVVTTKTGVYSRQLLEHFGVMDYFEVLIGSEDVRRHKPHPEPVLKALELMGGDPQRSRLVGDTCLDVGAARAANVVPIGVCCGYGSEEELRRCGAELCADALSAVKKIRKEFEMPRNPRQLKALLS
jgi:phosphoglycolate phosphatase